MKKSIKYISILALIILAILAFVFFVVPAFITTPRYSPTSDANSNAYHVRLCTENILKNYDFSELVSDEIIIKGKDFDIIDGVVSVKRPIGTTCVVRISDITKKIVDGAIVLSVYTVSSLNVEIASLIFS